MRKTLVVLAILASMTQPMLAMADDDVEVTTKSETTYTNPVAEVVLFPVRIVTGVIGAPIGAVTGLFTGFAKGFAFPGHSSTTTKTQTIEHDED